MTLTVLASGDDVELYVAFARPPLVTPDLSGLPQGMPATDRLACHDRR